MTEAKKERLADAAGARLAQHKPELVACLRRACPVGRRLDEEIAWRYIEGRVKFWAIEQVLETELHGDRRQRAEKLAASARQTRTLFAGAIAVRENGRVWETGGELISELWRGERQPIEFRPPAETVMALDEQARRREQEIQQIKASLEKLEKAATAVAARHRRRSRGRQAGSGQLPPDRVEWLADAFSLLTRSAPTSTVTGPFANFVRVIAEAMDIGLGDDGLTRAIKSGLRSYKKITRAASN